MIFARKVASEADDGFLFQVYASTREQEIAEWGWTKQQQEEFLQMQYTCQKRSYESNYPHMEWYVIVHQQEPIGRLLINKQHDYWTLADMTILPVYQGRGYGSQLLQELLESANRPACCYNQSAGKIFV
ncbi:GNAT family N-acetyltransferase [Brevibacillus halotolerans]|uniref:GNAT family N-acetyltransferase n=2 Tax=Brevibacillus TaxID=55080 RepID=A0ABT4HTZ9_9BACL|nr:GNAT family N-acetyltransferase [Brevibacillus halotolerans]